MAAARQFAVLLWCLAVSAIRVAASASSEDDLWAADQDDTIGLARLSRPHPPHEAASQLSPQAYFDLIRPHYPDPPISHAVVLVGSTLLFFVIYAFSVAIHSYLTDDIAAGIAMQHVELAMERDIIQTSNGHSASSASSSNLQSHQNGTVHHRKTPLIQVIPAVASETSPPRGMIGAYLHAYAVASAANLTTNLIEWNSRLVSNVHAFISCALGLLCFFASNSRVAPVDHLSSDTLSDRSSTLPLFLPFSSRFTPSLLAFNEEYVRDFSLMVTCGYLVYDLLLCLWVRFRFRKVQRADGQRGAVAIDDGLTLVHHVLIIFAFHTGVRWHVGTYIMSCFLLNEISTFGLNANFWLAAMGPKGQLYKLNGVALFVVFILARVVFNVYVISVLMLTWAKLHIVWIRPQWPFLIDDDIPIPGDLLAQCALLSALACGHVVINLIWFSSLYRAVRRKLMRHEPREAGRDVKTKAKKAQ
jgi:hypothetical protein